MDMKKESLTEALETLGRVLEHRGLEYDLLCVGGSCLLLLGYIERATKDIDVLAIVKNGRDELADPMPPDLVRAAKDVALTLGLPDGWINAGPTSMLEHGLPAGISDRVVTLRFGTLVLRLAGRQDQICFKFYAAVDQGPQSKHADDLRSLAPTKEELLAAANWARTQDPSEGFLEMSKQALASFGVEVGDEGTT